MGTGTPSVLIAMGEQKLMGCPRRLCGTSTLAISCSGPRHHRTTRAGAPLRDDASLKCSLVERGNVEIVQVVCVVVDGKVPSKMIMKLP